jgi:pimeloyl-ACP methyl ester carboxylesterase
MAQSQLFEDQYIKIDEINTRYWNVGNHGTPVVLLHGAGSSIEVWIKNIDALAQHHPVYAFDMVGSGLSDKPIVTYSLTYQLQFLKKFLEAFNIERAILIGNSLGGGIALKFALESPERVEKLVLVSSFGLGREISVFHRLLAAFPAIANLSQPSRQGAKIMLGANVYDSRSIPPEWIEISYQWFKQPGRKQAMVSMLKPNLDLWGVRRDVFEPIVSKLKEIKVPTLVVWGKQDRLFPVTHAHTAAKEIPNARLHIFDRCGHWAQLEYSQEFNNLVMEFLQVNKS